MRLLTRMGNRTIRQEQLDYLRRVIKETGWSATRIARESGVDASTLTRFLNKSDHDNNLSATTLNKIEGLTGIKAPLPTNISPLNIRLTYMSVIGVAAAGKWLEAGVMDETALESIPCVPFPKYAGHTQYAIQIAGTSINRKAQSGSYAVCVAYSNLGLDRPQNGKFVHVQRSRGGATETSIKQVVYNGSVIELCPYSDDPAHDKCLDLYSPEDDAQVQIKGLVIGWFSHED